MSPAPLWTPDAARLAAAELHRYLQWLATKRGRSLADYESLYQWSIHDLEEFWTSIWEFFVVSNDPAPGKVLSSHSMPGARWFEGTRLNYAEMALRTPDSSHVALVARSEARPDHSLTYANLGEATSAFAGGLSRLGVRAGDRVAAIMPNCPEAVIGFLATASIGAIWSVCPPEFGLVSVVDRLSQIRPRALLAVDGYRYGGKDFDRLPMLAEIEASLPTVEHVVVLGYLRAHPNTGLLRHAVPWEQVARDPVPLKPQSLAFEHPLWVLYSSGTTGLPKAIVHSHGGILLEHLKSLALHRDVSRNDRMLWITSTGWMMWNLLVSGLLVGATVVLYDGSPQIRGPDTIWRFADELEATVLGVSAAFIHRCMRSDMKPGTDWNMQRLRSLGVTASPLSLEGYEWVYEAVSTDLLLAPASGGTDICSAFVGPCPLLPVWAGEMQCRMLGAKVEALDERGNRLTDEFGELVVSEPMPSMPLYLWGDKDGERLKQTYFSMYPGFWRHGDWLRISSRGTCVILGRSDSTLNRGGVRMGTAEFYRVVEALPEVHDSLIVDTSHSGEDGKLLLFVVGQAGSPLDEKVKTLINDAVRRELSPRHVPDAIIEVGAIPRNLTGKKLEVPIKQILLGAEPADVIGFQSVSDPEGLRAFVEVARSLRAPTGAPELPQA